MVNGRPTEHHAWKRGSLQRHPAHDPAPQQGKGHPRSGSYSGRVVISAPSRRLLKSVAQPIRSAPRQTGGREGARPT
jgi:hypothetical protein